MKDRIRQELSWMNEPEERKRAQDALTPLNESKRPVSNSTVEALELKQNEANLNAAAIAAVVAADVVEMEEMEEKILNAKSNTTNLINTIKLPIPSPFDKKNELKDSIPGMDEVPDDLQNLCLFYTADPCDEKKEVSVQLPKTSFFKKNLAQRLHDAANDLLHGYGDKAEALVAENKWLARWETVGSDRFGRRIFSEKRTLIQMAAMNHDVNTRARKPDEKEDYGMLERLIKAGGLTDEEVTKQLIPVLFSQEAQHENEARKKLVLTVFIEFGEALLKRKSELPTTWETNDEFKTASAKCQSEIKNLRKDLLRTISDKEIKSGYIFDLHVFLDLEEWFKRPENLERFDNWHSFLSDIFWGCCLGSLQFVSAAPDAHAHHTGIERIVEEGILPWRTLKNSDGSSHFREGSRLGVDLYLGYYGNPCHFMTGPAWTSLCGIGKLISSKDYSIWQMYAKSDAYVPHKKG